MNMRCKSIRYVVQVCLMVMPVASFCQVKYSLINYNSSNGLPQNQVNCMAFDPNGYLWLTTFGGLCRFDGQNFTTFDITNTPALRSNRISELFFDDNAVLSFNDDLGTIYNIPNKIEIANENAVKNKAFTIVAPGIVFRYNVLVNNDNFPRALLKPEMWKYEKYIIVNNNECYVQVGEKLFYLNNKKNICKNLGKIPGDISKSTFILINDILLTQGGSAFVFYKDGVIQKGIRIAKDAIPILTSMFTIDRKYHSSRQFDLCLVKKDLYEFKFHKDSLVVVCIAKDACKLDEAEVLGIKYNRNSGIIFIATFTKGLFILKPTLIKKMLIKNSIHKYNNSFYDLILLDNGNILTDSQIFNIYNGKCTLLPVKLLAKSLFQCKDGSILFQQNDMICKADKNFEHKVALMKINSASTVCFMQDKNNNVWAGADGYIWLMNGKGQFEKKYAVKHDILQLFQFSSDVLWVISQEGFFKYQVAENRMTSSPFSPYLHTRSVYRARDSSIWIGTYGYGFYKYKHERFVALPLDAKGSLKNVHNFYEDAKGFFWLPTNNGLIQCLKSDLEKFIDDSLTTPYYYHYTEADGLLTNEFNGGSPSPYVLDKKGTIIYPSMNGAVYFTPSLMRPNTAVENIFIEHLNTDGKIESVKDGLILSPDFSQLIFRVGVAFYGNPDNLVMEYNINGLNSEWYKVADNKFITINRLPFGDYKLIVRKRNGFGPENYEYKEFKFSVSPEFYQRRWFIIFAIILFFGSGIFLFYLKNRSVILKKKELENEIQQRTAQLEYTINELNETVSELYRSEKDLSQANEVKEKAIAIILHDINAPVNYLSVAASGFKNNIDKLGKDEIAAFAGDFSRSALQVKLFTEDLLNWLLSQKENFATVNSMFGVYALLNDIAGLYSDIAAVKNNIIRLSLPDHNANAYTDRNILNLIIRNLVDNAVKNTVNGTITLTAVLQKNDTLHLIVADTGKGMSQQEIEKILYPKGNDQVTKSTQLGFTLIRNFLRLINASIEIQSEPGKGTAITIILPPAIETYQSTVRDN